MARTRKKVREITPGELYKEIAVSREEFEKGAGKLVKREIPPFVKFCRSIYLRFPSLGQGAKFEEKYADAVNFLGWDLKATEFAAASKFALIAGIAIGVIIAMAIYVSPINPVIGKFIGSADLVPIYLIAPFIIISLIIVAYIQNYPVSAANTEKTRALTYVPEIVGYMIMSMKLVPNLEKAIEFSAEHGTGKISDDFKRIIWDTNIGVYTTLSEALDALAYRWGKYSDEFKHALMMIRASVLENTEAKRYQILDKTMTTILASIREKMSGYARELSEPSVLLFYIGVLLPLILIIVLPVGSAFSGQAMASPVLLVGIYNIIIPAITLIFAIHVIHKRPPTNESPEIPDNYPGLPPKYKARLGNTLVDIRLMMAVVLIVGVIGSFALSSQGIMPKMFIPENSAQLLPADRSINDVLIESNRSLDYFDDDGPLETQLKRNLGEKKGREKFLAQKSEFFNNPKNDATPYNLIFGLLITISLSAFVFLHFTSVYKREAQLVIIKMETEFKDSLYILASRLGENKPVEEALKHTRDFLPGFEISKRIFARTVENIELLGMPLESAVFDKHYGSLRNIPSRTITTGMRILVDSVNLGVNVAARTIISLSMQLANNEKVNNELKVMISDTTGMMKTMSIFIAPIVLGITTALQKVVMITMSAIQTTNVGSTVGQLSDVSGSIPGGPSMSGFGKSTDMLNISGGVDMVAPWQFVIIVATYVLQLVVIMVYFSSKIEDDNDIVFRLNLAKALPIATTVFLLAVIASSTVVGNFMG